MPMHLRMGNSIPNHAIICQEAEKEWRNIKSKSADEIDNIIKEYMSTPIINPYFIPTTRMNYFRPIVEEPTPPPVIDPIESMLEISKKNI